MKKSKALKWIFISIGGTGLFLTSFTLLYNLLIPDVCHYHDHEINPIMDLFYSAGPSSGGHPEPTLFNFMFSFLVGGILGNGIYVLLTQKTSKDSKKTPSKL